MAGELAAWSVVSGKSFEPGVLVVLIQARTAVTCVPQTLSVPLSAFLAGEYIMTGSLHRRLSSSSTIAASILQGLTLLSLFRCRKCTNGSGMEKMGEKHR